jgi:FAD/FMN-containing dehydrogenase
MRSGSGWRGCLVPATLVLSALAGSTGCYSYRMRAADDSSAGLTQKHVLHSFFWGAVRGEASYGHCALHEDAGGDGLWQVEFNPTATDIVARVLTLGIWAPIHVTYDCAPERARIAPANDVTPAAAASGPDAVPVDEHGCYPDMPWENISGMVHARPRELCVPKPGPGVDATARVRPLEELVRAAEGQSLPVRALGAGWSFSHAPAGRGYMIDMRWFGRALPLPALDDYSPAARELSFAHFEGGASVDAVNLALEDVGSQLLTMGGSAGQTWIGAAQTGTHGSAIDLPPIADHVWALHVVGEGGRRFWIESAATPLTSGGYARSIGATYVRDDDVFDAALAGLGAFGIVYSAVVQIEPIHDYKRYRAILPLDASLRAVMKTLDFGSWKASPRAGERPYHFEVVVDPYNRIAGSPTAYVTTLWTGGVHEAGVATTGLVPSDDVGRYLRALVNADPADVPFLEGAILSGLYKPIGGEEPPAPLRYLFPKGIPQGSKPQSAEFEFPRARLDEALDAILNTIADHRTTEGARFDYPGALGIRFVKQTRALMGATLFPDTVTVEFAGIPGVDGLHDFYRRVNLALWQAGVPHTQHLGQANTYSACPQELHDVFRVGEVDRVEQFRRARARFMSPAAQLTFANEYTDTLGLTGAPVGGGACFPGRRGK